MATTAATTQSFSESNGWTLLHRAVAKNYFPRVKKLCLSFPEDLEKRTADMESLTPLLVAAKSGSIESFLVLLRAGANSTTTSGDGLSVVQVAASSGHVHLILAIINEPPFTGNGILSQVCYYVQYMQPVVSAFTNGLLVLETVLSTLLSHQQDDILAALHQCHIVNVFEVVLERVLQEKLVSAGASISKSVALTIPLLAETICQSKIPKYLISLMQIIEDTKACYRALSAIAELTNYASDGSAVVFALGGPLTLFKVLQQHQSKDLHIIAMKCIADGGKSSLLADQFASREVMAGFMHVLSNSNDSEVIASTLAALNSLVLSSNAVKQSSIKVGLIEKTLLLLKPFDKVLMESCILLLRSLCTGNGDVEDMIKKHPQAITILMHITEHGLNTHLQQITFEILWLTAGDNLAERRALATVLGSDCLVVLTELGSQNLQTLAVSALKLLTPAVHNLQSQVIQSGGIISLVTIIRNNSEDDTKCAAMEALENLSCRLGMQPNTSAQSNLQQVDGIQLLLRLYQNNVIGKIKEQALCTVAAYSIRNRAIKDAILRVKSLQDLLQPLQRQYGGLSIIYTRAICYLAYNTTQIQAKMVTNGGMLIQPFLTLASKDEVLNVEVAFQMVVLARIYTDYKPTQIMAFGIKRLMHSLKQNLNANVDLEVNTGVLICGLVRMRAGLAGGFVALGIIPLLVNMLASKQEETRRVAAVCLCLLTFHYPAVKKILQHFRGQPKQCFRMRQYCGDYQPSQYFIENWESFCRTNSLSDRR